MRDTATSGPPNSAEMAANDPAASSARSPRVPSVRTRPMISPATDPSAIRGASGPSTAPNDSEPTAAIATPGMATSAVGPPATPSSGEWPPSPGSSVRAATTTAAPTIGRPTTRYHCGAEPPRASGRSVHSQCSRRWTRARKPAATTDAGTPITRRAAPDEGTTAGPPAGPSPSWNLHWGVGQPSIAFADIMASSSVAQRDSRTARATARCSSNAARRARTSSGVRRSTLL